MELQRQEISQAKDRERLRRCGDLVTANLSRIQKGQTVLRTEDYYEPELREVEIPLSPQLSPQQNAARYYKNYARAKHAEQILTEQIARGEETLAYLGSVLEELSRAETEQDMAEIRAELAEQGYVRGQDRKKQIKRPSSRPWSFTLPPGF